MDRIMTECNLLKLYRRCKNKWMRRSSNTCCSKKILLLLVWTTLFKFAISVLLLSMEVIMTHATSNRVPPIIFLIISQVSLLLAPFIGWFADVKIGRYEVIKFAAVLCFTTSIMVFVLNVLIVEGIVISVPVLVMSAVPEILFVTNTCISAVMLPFLTDQLIGATADQLSTVVYWYYWAVNFGRALSEPIFVFSYLPIIKKVYTYPALWLFLLH